MSKKFIYEGAVVYPGVGTITDEDVYKIVLKHSRFIDRFDRSKMVEMTLLAQCILMGIFENVDPHDPSWMFYGKRSNILHSLIEDESKCGPYSKWSSFGT